MHGTFEEILVVRAVVSAGTSLIGSRVDGKGAFVIELERAAVQVLVVADKLFVYLHFGNHAVSSHAVRAIIQPKGLPE